MKKDKDLRKKSQKRDKPRISVALAGNPNVGKSTLFNSLTGMHRHTGNWAGKTVSIAVSDIESDGKIFSLADIPGTYSLLSHSKEEEIARDYICFGGAEITVVVCDATSLEHGLGLALQICEITDRVIICLNFMDEAEKCGLKIDTDRMSELLGVPVIETVARKKSSLRKLLCTLSDVAEGKIKCRSRNVKYPENIEKAIHIVTDELEKRDTGMLSRRWIALRLLEGDPELEEEITSRLDIDITHDSLGYAVLSARKLLFDRGIDGEKYKDAVVGAIIEDAEAISHEVVELTGIEPRAKSRKIDKILTGRFTAFPAMLILLGVVLWITLFLSAYPSDALGRLFSYLEERLGHLLNICGVSAKLSDLIIFGVYRTTTTVIAVMLPPMAIFFPLFTLLEDSGYLPRVAYNLDRPFAASGACGKQALTMCMGLGCNAVGITGARIIDSKRERLLAIITNSLMPCNGRLPMLLSVSAVGFIILIGRAPKAALAAVLVGLILLSVAVTFLATLLLSKTLLKGERSSFTIELPPYRSPEFARVIFRALTGKVCSVLLRAVAVAAPMGLLIFILSSICIDGVSLVSYAAELLEPIGRIMGLDGEILLAFILGLPANEIVIPILIMLYTSGSSFGGEIGNGAMAELFGANGWTVVTAVCTAIFALFHWPCSTSIITAYKETRSIKYTVTAVILPLLLGFIFCTLINFAARVF